MIFYKETLVVRLILFASLLSTSAAAQQQSQVFTTVEPSRLELLKTNNQWTEIASKWVIGGAVYEATTAAAKVLLDDNADRIANEIALIGNVGLCIGLEFNSFFRANSVGVSVNEKRTDAIWDALECAMVGTIRYLGDQVGWKEAGIVSAALLFLDWHYLPGRDLRR